MTAFAVFVSQVASTWFLTGLIWTVQRVHYPYFGFTDAPSFVEAQAFHNRRITALVGIAMPFEAFGALALVWLRPAFVPEREALLGAVLVAVIWASTAVLQIPEHRRLSGGPDPAALRRLVATNWIRTAAWSLRAVLLLRWLVRGLG